MKFVVLGSGSRGNSIAAWGDNWGVLIDAGLSCKQIRLRAEAAGVPLGQIHTLLVTHSHGDHTTSIRTLVEREGFDKVWCTPATMAGIEYLAAHPLLCELIEPRRVYVFPSAPHVKIVACETDHNAAGAVTYFIKEKTSKLAMFVETGKVTEPMWALGRHAQGVIIEANHDRHMCVDNEKRPRFVNERTYLTHLSNDQAAEIVKRLDPECQIAVFVHVSAENNDPELLKTVLRKAHAERSSNGTVLAMRLSTQEKATEVFSI